VKFYAIKINKLLAVKGTIDTLNFLIIDLCNTPDDGRLAQKVTKKTLKKYEKFKFVKLFFEPDTCVKVHCSKSQRFNLPWDRQPNFHKLTALQNEKRYHISFYKFNDSDSLNLTN